MSALSLIISGCTTLYREQVNSSPELWDARSAGSSNAALCASKDTYFGMLRSDEYRYRIYSSVVYELEKRDFDCKSIPEYAKRKEWWEDFVKEYEESLH